MTYNYIITLTEFSELTWVYLLGRSPFALFKLFPSSFFEDCLQDSDLGSCRKICYILPKVDGNLTTSPCLLYSSTLYLSYHTSLLSTSFSVCLKLVTRMFSGIWPISLGREQLSAHWPGFQNPGFFFIFLWASLCSVTLYTGSEI